MALNLLQQISALNPTELREACEEEIAHDFENCTKDANFARLCAPQLARILARDDLWVTREEVVLQALFKWVQASTERKSYLGMLLQHIDFISFFQQKIWQYLAVLRNLWAQRVLNCSIQLIKHYDSGKQFHLFQVVQREDALMIGHLNWDPFQTLVPTVSGLQVIGLLMS